MLRFDCTGVWPPDAPEAVAQAAGRLRRASISAAAADVGPLVLDRCFEGWDGTATLTAPDGFVTRIEADATFGKLQVYSAWDYPYVCVEPVTNANDGFNRAALDVPSHGGGRAGAGPEPRRHGDDHRRPRATNARRPRP